jgi:hypothetical protein
MSAVSNPDCTDCGRLIIHAMEEYKLRRNSDEHKWEPICMDCFRRMVKSSGGKYGDIGVGPDGKVAVEIRSIERTYCCVDCNARCTVTLPANENGAPVMPLYCLFTRKPVNWTVRS